MKLSVNFLATFHSITACGRQGGLMISALASGRMARHMQISMSCYGGPFKREHSMREKMDEFSKGH